MAGDSYPREMTIWPPRVAKQNSAYGPTTLLRMTGGKPYPAQWERVADLRVFRTSPAACGGGAARGGTTPTPAPAAPPAGVAPVHSPTVQLAPSTSHFLVQQNVH